MVLLILLVTIYMQDIELSFRSRFYRGSNDHSIKNDYEKITPYLASITINVRLMQTIVPGTDFGLEGPLVRYWDNFLSAEEADTAFFELERSWTEAKQDKGLFGVPAIRRTLQIGDDGIKPYKYSGSSAVDVAPWSNYPVLETIKNKIEQQLGVAVNLVLVNFYEPHSGLSWHTDKEDSMEKNSTIVSISLGSTRRFSLRELPEKGSKWKRGDKYKQYKPMLGNGYLVTMEGRCQELLEHCIPKMVISQKDMDRYGGRRINLTCRKMLHK